MITLPQITEDGNWAGVSKDSNDQFQDNQNTETTMGLEEHRRIVLAAVSLFLPANGAFLTENSRPAEYLRQLKAVYTTTSNKALKISKGIHQPTVNPHMQLTLDVDIDGKTIPVAFHLNVSARDKGDDTSGERRFVWEGVQFTAAGHGQVACWPKQVNVLCKETKSMRRRSIGQSDWDQVVEAVAAAKLKAEQKKVTNANRAEETAFIQAWTLYRKNNFAKVKGLTGSLADIQKTLKESGEFKQGGTVITCTFNKAKKTFTIA